MYAEFNPVLLLFLSYAIGVLFELLIKFVGGYTWFENQNFISDQLTKNLGVLHLGWLIRHSFMGIFNPRLKLEGQITRAKLSQLKKDMIGAEISHLFGFISLFIFSFFLPFWEMNWWYVIVIQLINIVFNLYLVFLQQYNKRRINRLLQTNSDGR